MLYHGIWMQIRTVHWCVSYSQKENLVKFRAKLWKWLNDWNDERWIHGHDLITFECPIVKNKVKDCHSSITRGNYLYPPVEIDRDEFFAWVKTQPPKPTKIFYGVDAQTSKYVRNKDHKKKHIEENPWREKKLKYFRKDRCRNWKNGARTSSVKSSNRQHRRWAKEKIHHEKYDEIYDNAYRYFSDPWDWD